jgi:hypothetical protein
VKALKSFHLSCLEENIKMSKELIIIIFAVAVFFVSQYLIHNKTKIPFVEFMDEKSLLGAFALGVLCIVAAVGLSMLSPYLMIITAIVTIFMASY